MWDTSTINLATVMVMVGAGLNLPWSIIVAVQGRRRGYSFFVWLVACVVSLNPLLILVILVMLPDARKKTLRAKEMKALEAKLGGRVRAQELGAGLAARSASVGDQSTAAATSPLSVGDEETRA